MHITVCICTYKRPELLRKLLVELGRQQTGGKFSVSVVVADNDRAESARPVVEEMAPLLPWPIEYCLEPEQNIALVRNRAVAAATGDFLAFIDDDEFPQPDWLQVAWVTCNRFNVAGVLAPVRPYFEHTPPQWLIRGRFCERPEYPTGYKLNWRETRTGNVLMRRDAIHALDGPFRRQFGNGGEDQDFFKRLMEQGCEFVWCNEAAVYEVVPPERCRRSYLLKRALQRGQSERGLADLCGVCKSLVAVPVYALALPFLFLAGQHWFMRYAVRLCDHAGKLAAMMGWKPLGKTYVSG
jgi:succinoglycan biosynthesis protein ExoM